MLRGLTRSESRDVRAAAVWENSMMHTSPTKNAPVGPEEPVAPEDPLNSQDYERILREVAERFGVTLTSTKLPAENPYTVSPERGFEIAVEAGIVTRDGKLKYPFD